MWELITEAKQPQVKLALAWVTWGIPLVTLVQLLKPKIRCMVDDNSLLTLDALRYIYALAVYNIKLFRVRQADQFPTYHISEFNVGDKVLVQNNIRDVWDPDSDIVHCMAHVMG